MTEYSMIGYDRVECDVMTQYIIIFYDTVQHDGL